MTALKDLYRGWRQHPVQVALVIGVLASAMMLLGAAQLLRINVESAIANTEQPSHLLVHLEPATEARQIDRLVAEMTALPAVAAVTHISREETLRRFRDALGATQAEFDALEVDMLPITLEVSVTRNARDVGEVFPLANSLRDTPGVVRVEVLDDWVLELSTLATSLRYAAWFIAAVVGLVCSFIVVVTARLGAPQDDQTTGVGRLLGANSRRFVVPRILDGLAKGAAAAVLAVVGLFVFFDLFVSANAQAIEVLGGDQPSFFGTSQQLLLVVAGLGFGALGSLWSISARR